MNKRGRLQIAAFQAYHRAAVIGVLDLLEALATALVNTSDTRMAEILKNNPNVIEDWYSRKPENRGHKRAS